MEEWIAKVICLVILLFLTMTFGLLPRLISTAGNEVWLSIANCVAGGVLLGTTLLHLVPETIEDVESGLKGLNYDTDYPIATLVIGAGFLLIVFIEMLAHHVQDRMSKSESVEELRDSYMNNEEINIFDSMERVRRFSRVASRTSQESIGQDRTRYNSWWPDFLTFKFKRNKNNEGEREKLLDKTVQVKASTGGASYAGTSSGHAHGGGGHGHSHDHAPPTEIKSFGSIILLFALSVHSILEGMAVGSERRWEKVFILTGALSLHKTLLALALGVKIVEEGQSVGMHLRSVIFFALSSPIGVAIGVGIGFLKEDPHTKALIEGLIQSVATGTFLYIAFCEIITPELNKPDLSPLLKVLFLAAGFAVMACVQLIPEGDDDDSPANLTETSLIDHIKKAIPLINLVN